MRGRSEGSDGDDAAHQKGKKWSRRGVLTGERSLRAPADSSATPGAWDGLGQRLDLPRC
jgi:hypothetical protein